jgi:dienelactone hydrolase
MKPLATIGTLLLWTIPLLAQDEPAPWPVLEPAPAGEPLAGTEALTIDGDISHRLISANDTFLDRQIDRARESRKELWKPGFDADARRTELAALLGLDRDERKEGIRFEFYGNRAAPLAKADGIAIYQVRWDTIDGIRAEGLLLEPKGTPTADIIAIPDADQSPEEIAGLLEGGKRTSPFALSLARSGARVLVPTLVGREEIPYKMTKREWLHRPAFELGRHLLGYELHAVLAGVDALEASATNDRPLGIVGWGEGGLHALYASALDPRIDVSCVSGYFGPREQLWKEPAEHNVFGLLSTFGDAEIAALVSPRPLVVEFGESPDARFRTGGDGEPENLEERPPKAGKPGRFQSQGEAAVNVELARLREIAPNYSDLHPISTVNPISGDALSAFCHYLEDVNYDRTARLPEWQTDEPAADRGARIASRQSRLSAAIDRHHQGALVQSRQDRVDYFSEMKTDSLDAFEESIEAYREKFRTEVIGDFELPLVQPNPRSRPFQVGEKTISYEVVLDVYDEAEGGPVIAYGILTLPKSLDLASGEKRPVVVCQHGLEGTPQDVVGEPKFKAYQAFATRLAERGYVTFAPQNGYKYFDLFRMQQFKSQSIGKTLFSIIVPQHQQITNWLADLPFVDSERIAFYGLSYGGKSAMRIPPLVDRYCLSICSADFNEWVWKNAATDEKSLRYSYANKGEYEIFEWNLGGTFNYAEMAALICPRPFMVERGHFDGVAPDETVAYEFAKVRNLYQARLGIGDRCEIEWFVGPHAIRGEGTYRFLDRHLEWEAED